MSKAPQPQQAATGKASQAASMNPVAGLVGRDMAHFEDVPVQLVMELGRVKVTVRDLLALAPGSLLSLPAASFEGVTVMVGDLSIARGEIASQDQRYGVRLLTMLDDSEPNGDRS